MHDSLEYLGYRSTRVPECAYVEEPASGVERSLRLTLGHSASVPVRESGVCSWQVTITGVHDVGRQGLMRTAITRHMPSATSQRREGRRKKKNVGAAGLGRLGVEMRALLNHHPQIPRRPLGFVQPAA